MGASDLYAGKGRPAVPRAELVATLRRLANKWECADCGYTHDDEEARRKHWGDCALGALVERLDGESDDYAIPVT